MKYHFFLLSVFVFILFAIFKYQKGRDWILLTGLTLPHFCVCLKARPRLPSVSIVVIGILRSLRFARGVIHVVVVGYIIDHLYTKV